MNNDIYSALLQIPRGRASRHGDVRELVGDALLLGLRSYLPRAPLGMFDAPAAAEPLLRFTDQRTQAPVPGLGRDDPARQGASDAAFLKLFGELPDSKVDRATAEALNPNSYDPKYEGVGPEIRVARIKPVPGQGVVRVAHWIEQDEVFNPVMLATNLGDGRGSQQNFDPEHGKVITYVDYENGIVVMRQNPSVRPEIHGPDGLVPPEARVAAPKGRVWQRPDGSVRVEYGARDGFNPDFGRTFGTVNGDLVFTPGQDGVRIDGTRTNFPSFEAYQDFADGSSRVVLMDKAGDHGIGPGTQLGPTMNLWANHDVGIGQDAIDRFRHWRNAGAADPTLGAVEQVENPSVDFGTVNSPPTVPIHDGVPEPSKPRGGGYISDRVAPSLRGVVFSRDRGPSEMYRSLARSVLEHGQSRQLMPPLGISRFVPRSATAPTVRADRPKTAHVYTADMEATLERARESEAQRALTYTGRWA